MCVDEGHCLVGLLTLWIVAMCGCSPQNVCARRPWECAAPGAAGAAGTGPTGTAGAHAKEAAGAGPTEVAGAGPTGSCDAYVPPDYASLVENAKLPDPFLSPDGTRVSRKEQWSCRRAEISAQARAYELGIKPGRPESVTGAFEDDHVVVTLSKGENEVSFSAPVTYPTTGTAPYPAMIGIGGIALDTDRLHHMGVATIVFPNDVVAEQQSGGSRGEGLFYELYGRTHTAGAMMAWAWGVSRLIDALEQTPDANIDPARLGVTGCSRNGKGALIAGAFDERIVLTIPQESGSGGSACWRVSDAQKADGDNVQTLSQITGENVWFTPLFSRFKKAAGLLPFDHHMIQGLVAPRALLVIENTWQEWLGNVSTYTCSMAAHRIWEALGVPERMGISQVGSSNHCGWSGAQQPEVTAYVEKYLVGNGTADTDVLETDGGYTVDESRWIDWTVPELD